MRLLLWAGGEAVLVFFVLSGFVLTLPLQKRSFSWRGYYPARLTRLYLPVWGSLVLAIGIFIATRIARPDAATAWQEDRGIDTDPFTLARAAVVLRGVSPYNGPLWSLYWEILFSLLLPAFAFLVMKWRARSSLKLILTLSATILGSLLVTAIPEAGSSLMYLSMFALGMLIAENLESLNRWQRRIYDGSAYRIRAPLLLCLAGLMIYSHWLMQAFTSNLLLQQATVVVQLLGAALLVFAAIYDESFKRLLTHPAVLWLGTISFSLYLVRHPIMVALNYLADGRLWAPILIGVPLSLLVAVVFYQLIERPSHRFSRHLASLTKPRRDNLETPKQI